MTEDITTIRLVHSCGGGLFYCFAKEGGGQFLAQNLLGQDLPVDTTVGAMWAFGRYVFAFRTPDEPKEKPKP